MIGIFDSGVGGLSVFKELRKIMPTHKYIYVADSANSPYGSKNKDFIIERCDKIAEFLIKSGVEIIVVACNTATSAAIDFLREKYDIPFVGMEPAVKPAALMTDSGVIGILATEGTLGGELYNNTLNRYGANIEVIERVGDGLVELVEAGETETDRATELLKKYLTPMLLRGADYLVLGCTHYPFLTNVIESIVEDKISIINPAPAVAKRTFDLLSQMGNKFTNKFDSQCDGNEFYTSGDNLNLLKDMVIKVEGKKQPCDKFYKIEL